MIVRPTRHSCRGYTTQDENAVFRREEGFGLFFSRHRGAGEAEAGADAVELTDAGNTTEALLDGALHGRTGDVRGGLAMLDQKGGHLPAQLDRVTMPSIDKGLLPFALHSLQQAIHGRTMHRDRTVQPRFLG